MATCLANFFLTDNEYLVAACTLHGLQKSFENGLEAAFGGKSGGIQKNLVQALFLCYNIQQALGELFYDTWCIANPSNNTPTELEESEATQETNINKIGCPITT